MDNAGHKEVKRKFKGDQEPSIIALQHEVQRIRDARSIPINSPVGESESNGKWKMQFAVYRIKYAPSKHKSRRRPELRWINSRTL